MTRRPVLVDRRARRPGRSATATRGTSPRCRDIRCRAELCTLAPRSCTARVLGRAASVVSPTHRWCGRVVAGGRWVVPPHWAPTAIGAPGMLGCQPVLHYRSRVASALGLLRVSAMWLSAPHCGSGVIGEEQRSTATLFDWHAPASAGRRRCKCRGHGRTALGWLGRQQSIS